MQSSHAELAWPDNAARTIRRRRVAANIDALLCVLPRQLPAGVYRNRRKDGVLGTDRIGQDICAHDAYPCKHK